MNLNTYQTGSWARGFEADPAPVISEPPQYPWYGVRTRSNFEKVAASVLQSKGFDYFLPLYRSRRKWSDRVVEGEFPLFPGYVFCRFDPSRRAPILSTPGVASIVSFGNEPAPIPEQEIAAVRTVLQSGTFAEPCSFFREGQRVRVLRGALEGVEGVLLKKKSAVRVIVSIEMLQRSISVEVDGDCISTT